MKKINRFDKYMSFKGLNDNQVTRDLHLSVGLLGKSRKDNRDLSDRVVEQILNLYTDLSRVWLLTGQGEMLVRDGFFLRPAPSRAPPCLLLFCEIVFFII